MPNRVPIALLVDDSCPLIHVYRYHWQSFFSIGLESGLALLDLLGERIGATLADEVEWLSCLEIAQRTCLEA